MKLQTLESMPAACVAFDTETHRIQPGLTAPPLVLASAGWLEDGKIRGQLLDKKQAAELFAMLLDDPQRVIAGANISFDLLVMALYLARLGVDAMPQIFAALMDDQRVFDILIAEQLDAVAEGCLGKDPRTNGPIINPETGKQAGYSLAVVTDLVLGRTNAKALGHVAKHYAPYDGVPLDQLPQEMQLYPVDDARNTAENGLAQAGHLPRVGAHKWGAKSACEWCGILPKDAHVGGTYTTCTTRRRNRNLHDLGNQVATAFAMNLGAAWGFRVDQSSVDAVECDALDGRAEAEEPFVQAGLLKRNRDGSTTRDMSAIFRRVAIAYGADESKKCETCKGTSKVISTKAKLVKCPVCTPLRKTMALMMTAGEPASELEARLASCGCGGTGMIPDPKQLVNCTECGATGLDLSVAIGLPKTDTGRVGSGRDVLNESGDETLMALADHLEDGKVLETYVPWLRRARQPIAGHAETCPVYADDKNTCTCPGPYRDIPLTLSPNVLLETGRTSYRGVVQLLPKKPRHKNRHDEWVPSLRECMAARDGWVYSSEDYEAGELVTHAQSCLWICESGSRLAEALNSGLKVHNMLGASIIGLTYEEFQKHVKEQFCKDARNVAKAGNFGFAGLMGPVKMVHQQRKQGPDTPHPSGTTMVKDEKGKPVRGYKGLRFCLLMDKTDRCGGEGNMATEWGWHKKPISPTCKRCIECSARLREFWLKQWSENHEYFAYVNECLENGQLITEEHLRLWPYLKPFFVANKRLAPGEIMQHVSGRVRGGLDATSMANGFFQGLLADLAKSALRRISRECYDSTIKVPAFAHENSKKSAYAGGRSPLFGHRPIVFAHDEIICEHPESEAHDGATRISEIMVEEMAFYCPDMVAACAAEPTLMKRWYKGATAVRDANGKLIPWEPKHD